MNTVTDRHAPPIAGAPARAPRPALPGQAWPAVAWLTDEHALDRLARTIARARGTGYPALAFTRARHLPTAAPFWLASIPDGELLCLAPLDPDAVALLPHLGVIRWANAERWRAVPERAAQRQHAAERIR